MEGVTDHCLIISRYEIYKVTQHISSNIAYFLPRNTDPSQLKSLAGPGNKCEVLSSFFPSFFSLCSFLLSFDLSLFFMLTWLISFSPLIYFNAG